MTKKLTYRTFTVHVKQRDDSDKDKDAEDEDVNKETPDSDEDEDAEDEDEDEDEAAGVSREVEGLAVPYGVETEIFEGFHEVITPGAVEEPEDSPVLLFWRHEEPIGSVIESNNIADGYHIRARISKTARGDEAYQLLQDGVISRLSIGFEPLEWSDTETSDYMLRTQNRIRVREVSLVPFPAYETAAIDQVRSKHQPVKEPTMTNTRTVKVEDIEEIRAQVSDLQRDLSLVSTPTAATVQDTRNAGAFLKALASGDQATRAAYDQLIERAWDGTKTSDDALNLLPMWTKDLVRIYESEDVIGRHFQQAALGGSGMSAEFLVLNTNTLKVDEQAAEGDDLTFGKLSTKTEVAKVKTFGGYTSLSLQEVERGSASLLTKQLQALAMAAGYAAAAQFEADFNAAVKANAAKKISASKAVSAWKWADVSSFIIDAAAAFRDVHLPLDGLIVDLETFKALAAMVDADDNPRMPLINTDGAGTTVGRIDTTALTGQLGALTVQPYWDMKTGDLGSGVTGCLFSSQAMTRYQTALTQLQDQNIINLSRQFSVYRYGLNAVEIPDGLMPVQFGTQAGA